MEDGHGRFESARKSSIVKISSQESENEFRTRNWQDCTVP